MHTTVSVGRRSGPTSPALWVGILALLTAIAPLATDLYLPAFPEIAADLNTGASTVQLSLTGFLVGLAAGQLVIGPLSDSRGRRPLLLAGTALCLVATVACALAPTATVLVLARVVQGFTGAAGIVLSRAVIVDRTTGARTARLFAALAAIQGVAPVVAPLFGSALLGLVGWRGLFGVLAALTAVMFLGVLTGVPESLDPERRAAGGLRATLRDLREVAARRRFVGYALTCALPFAAMFAYISGSPFVLQETLGLSTTEYALAFAANSTGLVVVSVLSARLSGRVPAFRQLAVGIGVLAVAAAALFATVLTGAALWPVLVALFVAVSSLGLILGNATALATTEAADRAGTGSALLGAVQFGLGAVVSPLVGSSPLWLAAVMLGAALLAVLVVSLLARRTPDERAAVR